ncbi:MAG: nucleotide exchange factor GrpE [Oscillospiraceae bacterium]|nr:nucleotide exchange factor GrpE [Oscillospiraceae bacterium]
MTRTNKQEANSDEAREPGLVRDEADAGDADSVAAADEKRPSRGTQSAASKASSKKESRKDKGNAGDAAKSTEDSGDTAAGDVSGGDAADAEASGAGDREDDMADPASAQKAEIAAERDKYLRLAAEYDNYRKRSVKERETTYNDARADTITKLLPVYDNLERALKTECADEAFYKGVEMIMNQLSDIMEGLGIVPIPAVGEVFDPNRHNAVMAIENPDLGEKVVAEEYQKGFMLGDRVIRFSTVVVAN